MEPWQLAGSVTFNQISTRFNAGLIQHPLICLLRYNGLDSAAFVLAQFDGHLQNE